VDCWILGINTAANSKAVNYWATFRPPECLAIRVISALPRCELSNFLQQVFLANKRKTTKFAKSHQLCCCSSGQQTLRTAFSGLINIHVHFFISENCAPRSEGTSERITAPCFCCQKFDDASVELFHFSFLSRSAHAKASSREWANAQPNFLSGF
jgi:hypothetical protein